MPWLNPLPLRLIATTDDAHFHHMPEGATGLPMGPNHQNAFGFVRKNHIHEGVDLFCPRGTAVSAVEDCEIVHIEAFTGAHANPPSPWWRDTYAVLVQGESGVVLYGEIAPRPDLKAGFALKAGQLIGHVIPVLTKDKGRPMTMLHLELHTPDAQQSFEWAVSGPKPPTLRDPTPYLLPLASNSL